MIEGRVEIEGRDPSVVRLSRDKTRHVQICLSYQRFSAYATVTDVDALIGSLQEARDWVKVGDEGDPLIPDHLCPLEEPHKPHLWRPNDRLDVRCPGWRPTARDLG